MRIMLATLVVFLGGFAIMVLEIIGARYLARDFGGSFYVWVSQIGVILAALALGYGVGGLMADRFRKGSFLSFLLFPAGIATFLIPKFSSALTGALLARHDPEKAVPLLWQKVDPAFASTALFFAPCFVLAALSPYMVRLTARRVEYVGRTSGLIYAASTVGSIAGVFISGYVLVDQLSLGLIFRWIGILIFALGLVTLGIDPWLRRGDPVVVS